MNRTKLLTVRFASLAAVLLICAVIFALSSESGEDSSKKSSGITGSLASSVIKDYDKQTVNMQIARKNLLEISIRKAAHAAEYMAVGAFSAIFALTFSGLPVFALKDNKKDCKKRRVLPSPFAASLAFLFCAGFASLDEIHQRFIPARNGSVSDVLLDTVAAVCAVLIVWGALRAAGKRTARK